jgi:hypothetical protein
MWISDILQFDIENINNNSTNYNNNINSKTVVMITRMLVSEQSENKTGMY